MGLLPIHTTTFDQSKSQFWKGIHTSLSVLPRSTLTYIHFLKLKTQVRKQWKEKRKVKRPNLDVQDACVMRKKQSREAQARHTVWQGNTHQIFNRHFLTQPPSPHSSWLISLQRPGRTGNSWATSEWQIRKQARKKVGLLEIPFQEVADLLPSWSTGLIKAQNPEANQ